MPESIGAARDNVKIRKKYTIYNVELVIPGMEGQERIHYAMPVRLMGYDYKMHLIEARKNNLKLHNINNIDLFNLLEILLNKDEKLKETKEKAAGQKRHHVVFPHHHVFLRRYDPHVPASQKTRLAQYPLDPDLLRRHQRLQYGRYPHVFLYIYSGGCI